MLLISLFIVFGVSCQWCLGSALIRGVLYGCGCMRVWVLFCWGWLSVIACLLLTLLGLSLFALVLMVVCECACLVFFGVLLSDLLCLGCLLVCVWMQIGGGVWGVLLCCVVFCVLVCDCRFAIAVVCMVCLLVRFD